MDKLEQTPTLIRHVVGNVADLRWTFYRGYGVRGWGWRGWRRLDKLISSNLPRVGGARKRSAESEEKKKTRNRRDCGCMMVIHHHPGVFIVT